MSRTVRRRERRTRNEKDDRMNSSVAVAIVNWNTRDHLVRCLESLRVACQGLDAEVLVVDNASLDGSADTVRRSFPEVRLFDLDENLGFAGGNNLAMRESRGDYVLILNPDIRADPASIRTMLDFLDAHPEAAGAAATLWGFDGRVQTEFYRRFPSRMQIVLFYTLLAYLSHRSTWLKKRYFEYALGSSGPIPVDQLPGACCMVRREVIEEIGLMDPDYFIWFEDVDWCYRMRKAGYQLFALPSARMIHAGGASFDGWSIDRRLSQFYKSMFRFLEKHDLHPLSRWAERVLAADLRLKEWIVRVRLLIPIRSRQTLPAPETLRALRRTIRQIVVASRRGELPKFSDDLPSGGSSSRATTGAAD